MSKNPSDPLDPTPIPPCQFQTDTAFRLGTNLTKGFNGGSLYKPTPPPPGGSLPILTYQGGNIWACDVFSGAQHWGANLHLSCPGDNPAGTLTVLYADTTGTYTGDYALNPTDRGTGTYPVQDPNEQPANMPVFQA